MNLSTPNTVLAFQSVSFPAKAAGDPDGDLRDLPAQDRVPILPMLDQHEPDGVRKRPRVIERDPGSAADRAIRLP